MSFTKLADRRPKKCYYQTKTKNLSFIKMWSLLDSKGIENSTFFLKIYDKRLLDIDPYDEDLTVEEQVAVFEECAKNKFYFIREVFRLPVNGSRITIGGGERFQLHRSNLAQLWAGELNLNTYTIAPRQTGKTWGIIADLTHSYQFTRGCNISHFNKSQKDSNENVARMKTAISMLPMYLQHSDPEMLDAKEKREIKNNEKFIKNVIGSTFEAMASATSETKADSMARGRTSQRLWFDEISFILFNDVIMDAALPTFKTARRNAEKYGMPYGVSITTTPGNLNNPAGVYAYHFMQRSITFYEEMYDMYENDYEELKKIISKSKDKNGFLFIQFHYYELGFDDDWYIDATRELDPIRARREYLLEWINSSGLSPFDIDDIDLLVDIARTRERNAKKIKLTKYYFMTQYSDYRGKLPVVVSCDVGTGIGRDYYSIVAVNPESLEPMAFFKSNNITSPNFKKVLIKFITKYFPYSIITIENNSIGTPLIQDLLETPIGRLIYREKKSKITEQAVGSFNKKRRQEGWSYGHRVDVNSRPLMTNILEALVRYNKNKLAYPELVDEIKFMEFRRGRIEHSPATHDDVTFGYLGALYVIKHGKGLKGKGITYNIAEDIDEAVEFDEGDLILSKIHNTILRRNKELYDEFDDLRDIFEGESYSMDDVLEIQEKEYRKIRDVAEGIDNIDLFEAPSVEAIPIGLKNMINRNFSRYDEEEEDIMTIAMTSSYKNAFRDSVDTDYMDLSSVLKMRSRF